MGNTDTGKESISQTLDLISVTTCYVFFCCRNSDRSVFGKAAIRKRFNRCIWEAAGLQVYLLGFAKLLLDDLWRKEDVAKEAKGIGSVE